MISSSFCFSRELISIITRPCLVWVIALSTVVGMVVEGRCAVY